MPNLALADLVSPYLLKGENLGAWHAALSALRVTSMETGSDDLGIAIRGRAEFNGHGSFNPIAGGFQISGVTDEAAPPFDPQRRDAVFDLSETSLDFELFVRRDGSLIIGQGEAGVTGAGFQPARAVLDVWDALPVDAAPSDFPSSGFTLDLIVNAPTVRPPFLHPASMDPSGVLVPDPSVQEVSLTLPRLRFRLTHGNAPNSQLTIELISLGATGLDDPGDLGVAQLIAMQPPYAFIGSDRVVGFGFRSATLDLSNDATPPDVVAKFGFGDDWGGLYVPEARFFLSPNGAKDLAVEAGVQDLLIGFGASAGLSGDFEVALIEQGDGAVALSARFFDAAGKAYGLERLSDTTARIALPQHSRMVIDVQGGLPPYTTTLSIDGIASGPSRLYNIDLTGAPQQTLTLAVTDATAGTPKTATLSILVSPIVPQALLPTPAGLPAPILVATPDTAATDPQIVIAFQTDSQVTLTTLPANPAALWSILQPPGGGETGPSATFTVDVGPGQTKVVRARIPGTTVPTSLSYYFYFDEPATVANPQQEAGLLGAYAADPDNVWTTRANSPARADGREPGGQPAFQANATLFNTVVPAGSTITLFGEVSFEADGSDAKLHYNYQLARRRAIAVREQMATRHAARGFRLVIDPAPSDSAAYGGPDARFPSLALWKAAWMSHGDPVRRDWWRTTVEIPPGLGQPERHGDRTVSRPAAQPPPPIIIPVIDPPPANPPDPPGWFRAAKVKARIISGALVAVELDLTIDFQTAAEEKLRTTGSAAALAPPPKGQTLQNGAPLALDNPADGLTELRFLAQADQATGRIASLLQIGADPADKDGLFAFGWLPGQAMPPNKDVWLTLAGSFISFWPMIVDFTAGNRGEVADILLGAAALAIPVGVAAIPWFRVERVIVYGGEYIQRDDPAGNTQAFLLFDVEADWSVNIAIGGVTLVTIARAYPLAVRYKAIGLRFGTPSDPAQPRFPLRPVFDASRGFTIDVARGGAIQVAPPFDKFLKILAARLSRTNPLTFEVDLGCAVDLGVVTIDRARLRVYLEDPMRPPELTAFGASIDVPGAIAGSGYLEIGPGDAPGTSKIGGQIDVTIRPVSLRVAASFEMQDVADPNNPAHHATAVFVALDLVLPIGIPLGTSGLGIFGFRGIFGMNYRRNDAIDGNGAAPALAWLEKSEGHPEHLKGKDAAVLWVPRFDSWTFGVGVLLGTMEGGVILNLDGTLILELPGPRVAIVMNARILSPPPSVDGMGSSGGILAIIEITPDHFLIGIILDYNIDDLIRIRIPVEAFFSFQNASNWHFYLGQRSDPVAVDVLGIIKGTGYLMIKGDGLDALPAKHLPAVTGFAIGAGAAASFTWGDTDVGLYLRIAGGFDAVIGFDPFLLAGEFELSGELRLFIVSIGASATLHIQVVAEAGGGFDTHVDGEACGHVDFFFFSVEGCVSITINLGNDKPALPDLVQKLSIKSRSPALLVGTGVDRPIDASLGTGLAQDAAPDPLDPRLPVVPIDSVLVFGMALPPLAQGLAFAGAPVAGSTGQAAGSTVQRGSESFAYTVTDVVLERADGGPALLGSNAPATWWTPNDASADNVTAQLALLTWEPDPATKAIDKTEQRKDQIKQRWSRVCQDAAKPAPVLWTVLDERLGPSVTGWSLEGLAWPDQPGTRRKQAPDTTLDVVEPWRSGDPAIDALRGIVGASVVGSVFRCNNAIRPRIVLPSAIAAAPFDPGLARQVATLTARGDTGPLSRLADLASVASPRRLRKIAFADSPAAVTSDAPDVLGRLARGTSVSRQDIAGSLLSPSAVAADPSLFHVIDPCVTRVLESPLFDNGQLIVFGSQDNAERVKEALGKAGVRHGPLSDVLTLKIGGFEEADILLFVRRNLLGGQRVVVRWIDASGAEIERVGLNAADTVDSKPLPPEWTRADGPWAHDVTHVLGWAQIVASRGYLAVWTRLTDGKTADRIEIGLAVESRDGQPPPQTTLELGLAPPYYFGAMAALRISEIVRADSESTEIQHERDVLTRILGAGATDDAYLVPGQLYKAAVTWSGRRQSDNATAAKTQTYWFRSDDTPPARLDPWVLLTTPADGEAHVFSGEPFTLVFNTHNVDRLFDAYGKALAIRFTASTANHPAATPGVPHPFPLDATTLKPAGAAILSPWEEALQESLQEIGAPCIPVDGSRDRLSSTTIAIPLDPYTDYRMDVLMVDKGAAVQPDSPRLYRRSFSTGAYTTLQQMAADMQAVKVRHRAVQAGRMAALLASFAGAQPQGEELDAALRTAGIEAVEGRAGADIQVFWEMAGALPQPVAVMVSGVEPFWRSRPHPEKITDTTGLSNATRWSIGSRDWLVLQPGATSTVAIAANGLLRAPGDQRALVVLGPGARGARLTLDLVRTATPPEDTYLVVAEERQAAVDLSFSRAPWEE